MGRRNEKRGVKRRWLTNLVRPSEFFRLLTILSEERLFLWASLISWGMFSSLKALIFFCISSRRPVISLSAALSSALESPIFSEEFADLGIILMTSSGFFEIRSNLGDSLWNRSMIPTSTFCAHENLEERSI